MRKSGAKVGWTRLAADKQLAAHLDGFVVGARGEHAAVSGELHRADCCHVAFQDGRVAFAEGDGKDVGNAASRS